ncbi:MAG: NfeD family protein, partial [Planctomycetota bacterium]
FGPIPDTERAKLESPILAEVVDSARRHHYDENLVQSFISVGVELWLIEHVDTGEMVFVDAEEYARVFGEPPPRTQTPVAPAPGAGPAVVPWFSTFVPEPPDAGDPGLSEEDLRAEIEFQQQLPPTRPPLTADDGDQWRLVAQVVSGDRLLVVKAGEAIHFGLAAEMIANDGQLQTFFGATQVTRYDQSWSESLVRLLVSWPVRIVLIIIFLLALFIELAAPGMGVFGATAGVALLVLVGAPYLAGLAQWWDILLIVSGLLLVAAELFVIPGLGVAGVLGVVCVFAGLVGTFISGDITSPQGQSEAWTGMATTLTAMFAAAVGIWLIGRQFHSIPLLNRIVLRAEVAEARRGQATGILQAMGSSPRVLSVGDTGVAETDLRPAGHANFDGRLVDVKSVAPYIERGTTVRVVSVGRFVIEVEVAES